jgi:hypothetical protein
VGVLQGPPLQKHTKETHSSASTHLGQGCGQADEYASTLLLPLCPAEQGCSMDIAEPPTAKGTAVPTWSEPNHRTTVVRN